MKLDNLIPKVFKPFDLPELSPQNVSRYNRNCWPAFYILSLTLPKLHFATFKTARILSEGTVTCWCSQGPAKSLSSCKESTSYSQKIIFE